MAPPPPPHPAVLMDELVEQYLLRLPLEDPADLARAALVGKQWHRVVTGAVFRRRYIEFHRSAPLLGYVDNLDGGSIRFVSISSSFRPRRAHRRDVRALHSSHCRILLRSTRDWELNDLHLFVWNPMMNKEWELPVLLSTPGPHKTFWDAAVVCAGGYDCSHLDCHFKVVVVGEYGGRTFSCCYSSEAGSWSDRIFVSVEGSYIIKEGSVLVGNTLYFKRRCSIVGAIVIKYDSMTHQICTICLQCGLQQSVDGVLIATEDGRLGFANISSSTLSLWLEEQGRLAESRVIQLHGLLPDDALRDLEEVAAFVDNGAGGVIFLNTCVGYFTINLRSGRSEKVGIVLGSGVIVPYVSFCTPAPGTVSTDEEPRAKVVVTAYDEPGPGVAVTRDAVPDVAVSTDEEPGDDVVASTDEGLGPSMSLSGA